ncbi:N-acetylglucosamine-6-sulfatase-like [Leptidea sinapis]|uniref:N-acetylglucosamine-6-sulfatase-like n=1 Tax=Leptidea sinapis TaxID=189913 RepID=UPI002137966D|nr:N-acetylglucosamine-6-sulfatase-like [Leptidea sinapis]
MLSYILSVTLLLLHTSCLCAKKPNFVIFLTDDQDVALDGMKPMKNVQRLIGNEGTTFNKSYTTTPLCCPSRASILTGLYVHNHHTWNNSVEGGCYGSSWKQLETSTFSYTLNAAGYSTFYAGKYLNQYGKPPADSPGIVPLGWTEWHGLVGNSVYFGYTLSHNGVSQNYFLSYLTDVIRNLGISFIKNQTEFQPFLMVLAPPAPHSPFIPAPRHKDAFFNVTAVRHPNFNVASTDKHWMMTMPPAPLPQSTMAELDRVYRSRWETLLSVDEMVADIVEALDTNNLLEDTYIIYTSDNGYHIGQYSQLYDKRQPYEADIKVPLIIRGPNIQKDTINNQPILNVDLAPTILRWAGLDVPKSMDGRLIQFQHDQDIERKMLVEHYGESGEDTVHPKCPWKYDDHNLAQCNPKYYCKCQDARNNTFACIRHISEHIDKKYCAFLDEKNFKEMYDLSKDPYELKNIIDDELPSVRDWYHDTLTHMLQCKGVESCDKSAYDQESTEL